MRTSTYVVLASLGTALCIAGALTSAPQAQAPPPTLPASTVYGRTGISAGPGQAIPFATLLALMFNGTPPFTAHSVLIGEGANPVAGAVTGTAGQLLIDQGAGNDPLFAVSSGDVTNTAGGVFTINASAVTNAKLANMAANSVKCNNTGGVAVVLDCTAAQTNALLGTVINVRTQNFQASGTYTPSAGLIVAIIECVGNGGGGGGNAQAGGNTGAGGGGGAGSYSRVRATAATIGASQTVTFGAQGTGGAAGNNAGVAGGDVSVGAICIGKGGSAGGGSPGGATGAAGAGGIAGTGDITIPGNSGAVGVAGSIVTMPAIGGTGGAGPWGGAGLGNNTTVVSNVGGTGGAATGFGSGGGGSASGNGNSNQAGGNGKNGIVYIWEFTNQ